MVRIRAKVMFKFKIRVIGFGDELAEEELAWRKVDCLQIV